MSSRRAASSQAWFVWGAGAALYLAALFHRMSLGVAALEAEKRYGISSGTLSLFSALQLAVYLAMQIPAGVMADRWGPRRTLTLGIVAMGVGELLFARSTTLTGGLIARALIGGGDACIFLNVLRLGQNWFSPQTYPLASTLTGFAGGIGQLATTLPLSTSLRHFGWTHTFAVSGFITLGLALIGWLVLRDRPPNVPAPTHHEPLPAALRGVLSRRGTWLGTAAHFTLMGPFVVVSALWGFPYLVQAQHLSRGEASSWLLLMVAVFTITAPLCGAFASRNPHRRLHLIRAVTATLCIAWLVLVAWPGGRPPLGIPIATFFVSASAAAVSMLSFESARADNTHERGGTATGIANCGGFTAAGLAMLAIGGLLDLASNPDDLATFTHALTPVLLLALLGASVVWRLSRWEISRPRAEAPSELSAAGS